MTTPLSGNVTGGIRNFGALGNDEDGDCVDAAVEHIVMCKSTTMASRWKKILYYLGYKPPSTKYTLALYAEYLATLGEKPGPETGVDPGSYLAWLLAQGDITSWGIIKPEAANQAILDYRGILAAVALTTNSYEGKPGALWIVGPNAKDQPNPQLGHGIAIVEYTPTEYTCVTWGYLQDMTVEYLDTCSGPNFGALFVFTTTEDEDRLGHDAYIALVAATNALPKGD